MFLFKRRYQRSEGPLLGWRNRNTKQGLIGGSTSLWRTVTAPVKDEDDGDQERASLTCEGVWCLLEGAVTTGQADCEWHLVPLGGHGDSRASGLASGVWCLLEGTVMAGQAELRSSGHLLDAQQERPLLIWE